MCVVSMIIDHYRDRWDYQPQPNITWTTYPPIPSKEEVEEFRKLLERAREYDKRNNEPNCEMEEKKQAIKTIAKTLGVDISFVDET